MCSSDLRSHPVNMNMVKQCVGDIRTWMIRNRLKINDRKTELLLVKSQYTNADISADLKFQKLASLTLDVIYQ